MVNDRSVGLVVIDEELAYLVPVSVISDEACFGYSVSAYLGSG